MIIGVPKEIMPGERRVSATPETVKAMRDMGLTVLVQKDAGEGAYFHDPEYIAAGAEIVENPAEIFERADMILKVKEPQFNNDLNKHEADMMHEGQYLITFIHPAAPANHAMVKNLAARGVTSITLDCIPRNSRAQSMDALTSMSTCAGYKGSLMAANHLPVFMPMMATAVGMIKPIQALVVGAGVGGLQAIATIKRLGAIVHAADIRPDAAEQAMSLGAKVLDLGIAPEDAIGDGGYALALSPENLAKERAVLAEAIKDKDIIFLSALVPGKEAPILITEEMVKNMKPGSVIVDISIDQGGNCEITPPGKIEEKHGVTIIGIKNIPGMLPTSSTWMFSQNVLNLVKYLVKDGEVKLNLDDDIIKEALTTHGGKVVHQGTLEAFALHQ
jgi:NAD(P) transhydrogenase subunit alpha